MRIALLSVVWCVLLIADACALDLDSFIDGMDERLRLSAFDDNVRARLSGTFDL